jgi:signal transduction histidine kinase
VNQTIVTLPTASISLRWLRGLRSRFVLVWIAFLGGSLVAAFALHRLHTTVQRELIERGQSMLEQERSEVQARVKQYAQDLRASTVRALAAFHVEGLAYALRQWDKSEPEILGTFVWSAANGFVNDSALAAGSSETNISGLWLQFRDWRTRHPSATVSDLARISEYETAHFCLLNSPEFAAAELGYQNENLEILTYEGGTADPWAGWGGNPNNISSPWVIWYQTGPTAPVRGCSVDYTGILTRLRSELKDSNLVRLSIVPSATAAKSGGIPNLATLSPWLPGYSLLADYGDLFIEKQSSARLTTMAAALLLVLVLVGAAFLSAFSRREATEAERRTTFVTQVSHELRTPLTSIRIFADMLSAPALAEEKRTKYAGSISRESQRLGDLIERLLTFSTLERGKHSPTIAPVDVVGVVEETFDEMETTLAASGIEVQTAFPSAPIIAASDRSTLKQALLNLVDNAVKYAVGTKIIRVSIEQDGALVRLRVGDNGPGVAPSMSVRIFEPFVQGGGILTDKPAGVGLGLSIARGLLRGAGGDLLLLPSTQGALFEIRLRTFSA